jgi:3-methyladenine DNA glycosylase AlkC
MKTGESKDAAVLEASMVKRRTGSITPAQPGFIQDPRPVLPILEAFKDDADLHVRRSVANHLGDIAQDHPRLVFEICERWLDGASEERKRVIRHAVRHPAKKGDQAALRLRRLATQDARPPHRSR